MSSVSLILIFMFLDLTTTKYNGLLKKCWAYSSEGIHFGVTKVIWKLFHMAQKVQIAKSDSS